MKIFCENNERLLPVNCFRKKVHYVCLIEFLIRLFATVTNLDSITMFFLSSFLKDFRKSINSCLSKLLKKLEALSGTERKIHDLDQASVGKIRRGIARNIERVASSI